MVALFSFIPRVAHAAANPLDVWRSRNPLPQLGNHLYGVAADGNTCVVFGAGGKIITSTDGYNWVERVSGTTNSIRGMVSGNGTWVAVGDKGTILTSTNGTTWTVRNPGSTNPFDDLRGVAYGLAKSVSIPQFVAVGYNGKILTSPDGVTWTYEVSPTNAFLRGIAFGDGVFVAVGEKASTGLAIILNSDDGATWSSCWAPPLTGSYFTGVTYGEFSTATGQVHAFVAVGNTPSPATARNILLSTDGGTNWTAPKAVAGADIINGMAFGNGTFVGVSAVGTSVTSTDTDNWLKWVAAVNGALTPSITAVPGLSLNGVAFFKGVFVAVGNDTRLLTSPDGKSWVERSAFISNFLYGVAYGNNTYAAVGWSGRILTSTDMSTWVDRASGTQNSFFGITYGASKFVTVGSKGNIRTSSTGTTWTARTSGITGALFAVTYGAGKFVAVGEQGAILTSPTGVTWTPSTSGTSNVLYGVTYGNGVFLAVGQGGIILSSMDGISWDNITPSNNGLCLYGVAFGGNIFIVVGDSGTILTSSDRVTWTKRTSGTTNGLTAVTYVGAYKTFVVAGAGGKVLTSNKVDGSVWMTQASCIPYSLFGLTVEGSNVVVVGAYSTILSSATPYVKSTIRSSGTYKILKGITYGKDKFVAVGEIGSILTSGNGVVWDVKTSIDVSPTSTISSFNAVTYGNNLFVAVGDSGGKAIAYSSDNGITWTKNFPTSAWVPPSPSNLYTIHYLTGTAKFIAAGIDGIFLTSNDGVSWIPYLIENVFDARGVTNGNGTFVMVGDFPRTILTSTSVISPPGIPTETFYWTIRYAPFIPTATKQGYNGVAFGNGIFAAVGASVKIVMSSDFGLSWKQSPLFNYTGTFDFTGITYGGNSTFCAVGTGGKILTSPDGKDWTFRKSGTTKDLFGMNYGTNSTSGNFYVAVGAGGTILQSGMVP